MATVDLTKGGTKRIAASGHHGSPFALLQREINTNTSTGGTNRTAADVLKLLSIPANTHVLAVYFECLVAEGATATMDVGDGVDPNGWDDAVNANSVAGAVLGDGAFAIQTTGGKLYAAADTINVTLDHTLDAAKFRVSALCLQIPPFPSL